MIEHNTYRELRERTIRVSSADIDNSGLTIDEVVDLIRPRADWNFVELHRTLSDLNVFFVFRKVEYYPSVSPRSDKA